MIRAYRSVRLLEAGDSASVFRFSELFRYVAEEGQRLSPWISFDEAVINEALATQGDGDIAQVAAPFCASDGAVAKFLVEVARRGGHLSQ